MEGTFIVYPLCSNDFFDFLIIGNIPERIARYYFLKLISVVEYLYNHGICHRDIKPQNIIIDEDFQPRLFDFS